MSNTEKTGEVGVLIDEIEVAGYTLRPWGIGALSKVAPHLEAIINGLKDRGVKLDEISIGTKDIDKLIFSILPQASNIVAITLKISLDEVDNISASDSPLIVFTIVKQNLEYLKNWLSPIRIAVGQVVN